MLLEKIFIALLVTFTCTVIHAAFMMSCNRIYRSRVPKLARNPSQLYRAYVVWLIILWMLLAIMLEASVWGLVYLMHPEITELSDAQTAFYFSLVTYTALGYGDIYLQGDWRALSAIQAANGLMIFGWSTALIFYYIQQIQKPRGAYEHT